MLLSNEQHMAIVGCFVDGDGLLSFLQSNTLDIILLDITLPNINGMDLCREIKKVP